MYFELDVSDVKNDSLERDVMYNSGNDWEYLPEEIEEDTDEQSSDCSDIERPTKKNNAINKHKYLINQ